MNGFVLKSVSKSFRDKKVINSFSYDFILGNNYCIMGESGCGKTTLLNLIMGILPADSGEISGGLDSISAVFQEDRLCEDFSAVGNLIAVSGRETDATKIHSLLDELGLAEHKNKPVLQLSGGQKRRVAIGRALLTDSKVVLMDEPFKGLDEELKERVAKTILERTKDKILIVATHDINDCQLLDAIRIELKQ